MSFVDSQALGVTMVKARLEVTAQPCSVAAHAALVCSRLPVSKQCAVSRRSAASYV